MSYDVLRRDDGGGMLVAPAGAPAERLIVWEGLLPLPVPDHPSIAPVAFTGEFEGKRVYAERVPRGVRLDDVDLTPGVSELVVARILEGVAHLHRHRLLHGDIDRRHVILGTRGEVVVTGRGRKGGIPALDLVAGVGLLDASAEETLPGESAELAAAELSRRVPPDAVARLIALVEAAVTVPTPLARVALGPPSPEGTDEVVPDLGPDSGDHGILDRWGTTTATGMTGETTPAARTDAGNAPAVDQAEELWTRVGRVVQTPWVAGPDLPQRVRALIANEPATLVGTLAIIDEAVAAPRADDFNEEPPTAVRRAAATSSLPPVELTSPTALSQAAAAQGPRVWIRALEILIALGIGFAAAALLAWLW